MMASNDYKKCTTQKHPKMLKEFLQENTTLSNYDPTIQLLLDQATLPRSRTRSRTALSSFRKLLNSAVKSFHHSTTSSSPKLLSRSLSTSFLDIFSNSKSISKYKSTEGPVLVSNNVKVKDILKWRSFCNLVIEDPIKSVDMLQDNNMVFQDNNNNTINASSNNCDMCIRDDLNIFVTTTRVDSCSDDLELELESNISKLSYGESEFCCTMDELPCWWGNLVEAGEMCDYNNDVIATICDVGPKEDDHSIPIEDEKDQHSPVSVLDFPFGDEISDQEFESSFDKSFANMERTKQSLLQSIQWLESLAGVPDNEGDETTDLSQEDNTIGAKTRVNRSRGIVKLKRGGKYLKDKKMCMKDMEQQAQWSKFDEEKGELVVELEILLLNDLVSEILDDF